MQTELSLDFKNFAHDDKYVSADMFVNNHMKKIPII